ncbi:MAG: biotin--[acetyl-CoA-carboxylase] ligase [Chlorobi bacterium]|nr:biotin--[acetyl-CoA-carboxylase] ligase [Chlorobiota bacterium]
MHKVSNEKVSGFEIFRLKEVESTNSYVRACLDKMEGLNHRTIVIADKQTAGKGMGSNTWYSEAGKNLNLSIYLKPESLSPEKQFILNKAMALAVFDFVEATLPHRKVRIKWPNDIYVGDEKTAGILISNTIKGSNLEDVIVGIGININQEKFPGDIPNPASLSMFLGSKLDLNKCVKSLCRLLNHRYEQIISAKFHNISDEYNSKLYRLNEMHGFKKEGVSFLAEIKGVSGFGQLQLKTSDGENLLFGFKEVEYII